MCCKQSSCLRRKEGELGSNVGIGEALVQGLIAGVLIIIWSQEKKLRVSSFSWHTVSDEAQIFALFDHESYSNYCKL